MLSTIKTIAGWIFGTLLVWVIVTLAGENLKEFARKRGWNNVLVRSIDAVQPMMPGWQRLREKWLLWLAMGVSAGIATSLWLIALFPPSLSASTVYQLLPSGSSRIEVTGLEPGVTPENVIATNIHINNKGASAASKVMHQGAIMLYLHHPAMRLQILLLIMHLPCFVLSLK